MTVALTPGLRDRLAQIERRYEQIGGLMSDPSVVGDRRKMRELGQEHASLGPIVSAVADLRRAEHERDQAQGLIDDPEMKDLAREELAAADANKTEPYLHSL